MVLIKDFFSDFKKTIIYLAAAVAFFSSQGSVVIEKMLLYKIIAFQEKLVFMPLLAEHIWYIRGGAAAIILLFIYNLGAHLKGYPTLDIIKLFMLVSLLLVLCCLLSLARPIPWSSFIAVLCMLYGIVWLFFKIIFYDNKPE